MINLNIVKGSLSSAFNDVPKLIIERFVRFITIPLVHIFHSSFPNRYSAGILKLGKIQPMVIKRDQQYMKNKDPYEYYLFFLNVGET